VQGDAPHRRSRQDPRSGVEKAVWSAFGPREIAKQRESPASTDHEVGVVPLRLGHLTSGFRHGGQFLASALSTAKHQHLPCRRSGVHRPVWCYFEPTPDCSFSSTWSRLKLAAFWRGGNSSKVFRKSPTIFCAGTNRNSCRRMKS